MINTHQLIVLMPLFEIQMPANAQVFFNRINEIASFNMIDIEPYINRILRLEETGPFNPNFSALGFTSLYFLNNMNSLILAFIFYLLLVLLNLVVDRLQSRLERLDNLAKKLRQMLFYNMILEIITESYSIIAVCCMIGLNKLSFSFQSYGETIQTASCIFALLVIILYPFLVFCFIKKSWKNKEFDKIQEQFQPIFQDLTTEIGPKALIHPMYFLLRRFLLAITVVFLKDFLIFQVMLQGFTIIAGAIIIGYIEFDSRWKRNSEFFNEITLMLMLYCIICFSPFVPNPYARQFIGYWCCVIVSTHLAINLTIMSCSTARELILRLKLWLARNQLFKQRKQNLVKIQKRKHVLKDAILARNYEEDTNQLRKEKSNKQFKASVLQVIEEEGISESQEEKKEIILAERSQTQVYKVFEELDRLQKLIDDSSNSEEEKIETKHPRAHTENYDLQDNFHNAKSRTIIPVRSRLDIPKQIIQPLKQRSKVDESWDIFEHDHSKIAQKQGHKHNNSDQLLLRPQESQIITQNMQNNNTQYFGDYDSEDQESHRFQLAQKEVDDRSNIVWNESSMNDLSDNQNKAMRHIGDNKLTKQSRVDQLKDNSDIPNGFLTRAQRKQRNQEQQYKLWARVKRL